jgi:hypothetical protein
MTNVREEMTDATEIQQQHKGPGPDIAATTGKQMKCQRDPETNHSAGGEASSWVFCQDYKYWYQDSVEKPVTAQAEETTHNLKVPEMQEHLLGTSSLKKGAMGHVDSLPSNSCLNRRQ